jgi:hypothetical protein
MPSVSSAVSVELGDASSGATWTMMADVMPFVVDIDQAADAGRRAVEVCAILKGHEPPSVAATGELAQPSAV